MKAKLITFAVIAALIALFYYKPWQAKRYDDTPAGVEARKIDRHVDNARNWRPPQTWEAREFINKPPVKGVPGSDLGLEQAQALKLVDQLYQAGAKTVMYLNIKRSVRFGDQPEGFFAELPDDPTKRAAIIALTARWPRPPKDVNQKYIYYGIEGWSPDDPEPSFMGDTD